MIVFFLIENSSMRRMVGDGSGLHAKEPRDKHVFDNQQNIFLINKTSYHMNNVVGEPYVRNCSRLERDWLNPEQNYFSL